jgi:hypothetical protein
MSQRLSVVSDHHLRAIGAVVVNWQAIEMVMELTILGLYEISPDRGLVITSNLSFQNKLTILQILALRGAVTDKGDPASIRHALTAPHKGNADIPANRQFTCCPAAAGHTKIESTVRYLGIEVDDALAIAEQVDV